MELFEKVLRCLGRGLSFTEGVDEAAVETEALELVEEWRLRQPNEASDEAVDSRHSSLRATLSGFDPYAEESNLNF